MTFYQKKMFIQLIWKKNVFSQPERQKTPRALYILVSQFQHIRVNFPYPRQNTKTSTSFALVELYQTYTINIIETLGVR